MLSFLEVKCYLASSTRSWHTNLRAFRYKRLGKFCTTIHIVDVVYLRIYYMSSMDLNILNMPGFVSR